MSAVNMRPDDPSLLYDQANHVTEKIWAGKDPGAIRCLQTDFPREQWVLNDKQMELVRRTGLHHLAELKKPTTDRELIRALIERWRPETNTFHFTFGEATVTLEDVNFIYGLPIDGDPIIGKRFAEKKTAMQLCRDLLGDAPDESDWKGSNLKNSWLQENFGKMKDPSSEEEIYQVRAFLFDLVSSQILTNKNGVRASAFILQFFVNFERRSWGSACLANLYRQLGQAATTTRTLPGSNSLLQYWAQSRMALGSCELKIERAPFAYPLGHVFYSQSPTSVKNDHEVYRSLLDSLDENAFNWNVYMPISGQLLHSTEERDRIIFRSCTYLFYMWVVEWHNPDRVYKQFSFTQVVPPVFRKPLDRIAQLSTKSVDYETMLKDNLAEWNGRAKTTINGDLGDSTCHSNEYFKWYYKVTVRFVSLSSRCTAMKKPPRKPPIRKIDPLINKRRRFIVLPEIRVEEILDLLDGIMDASKQQRVSISLEDTKNLSIPIFDNAYSVKRMLIHHQVKDSAHDNEPLKGEDVEGYSEEFLEEANVQDMENVPHQSNEVNIQDMENVSHQSDKVKASRVDCGSIDEVGASMDVDNTHSKYHHLIVLETPIKMESSIEANEGTKPSLGFMDLLTQEEEDEVGNKDEKDEEEIEAQRSMVKEIKERQGTRTLAAVLRSPFVQQPKKKPGVKSRPLNAVEVAVRNALIGNVPSENTTHPPLKILIEHLRPREEIRDDIIFEYAKLIRDRAERMVGRLPNVVFFNPLLARYAGQPYKDEFQKNIRTINHLHAANLLLLPTWNANHWFLLVGDADHKVWMYINSILGPESYLEAAHNEVARASRECKELGRHDVSDWNFMTIEDAPQQSNVWDCGLFTMLFMERISRRAPFEFSQCDMTYFRKRVILEVYKGQLDW